MEMLDLAVPGGNGCLGLTTLVPSHIAEEVQCHPRGSFGRITKLHIRFQSGTWIQACTPVEEEVGPVTRRRVWEVSDRFVALMARRQTRVTLGM